MTAYHKFISLLYEAAFAAEVVDHFDLSSDEPANAAAWNWLRNEEHKSLLALVEHVQLYTAQIVAGMDPPNAEDIPDDPPPMLLQTSAMVEARFAFLSDYAIAAEHAAREIDGKARKRLSRLAAAHSRALYNRRLLANGGECGCFHCLRRFDARDVTQWSDANQTARCPHCGMDTVLSAKADPIDDIFLKRVQQYWLTRFRRRAQVSLKQ
jgi:hypothetical protein